MSIEIARKIIKNPNGYTRGSLELAEYVMSRPNDVDNSMGIEPHRIEYMKKLIKAIREQITETQKDTDYPYPDYTSGEWLDIDLLCSVVEKDVIKLEPPQTDKEDG